LGSQFDIFKILIGSNTETDFENKPVIIQGITGSFGSNHTKLMKGYGTNIAAGVTPGKGGSKFEDIPVYNTMKEAIDSTGAIISGIFVPAPFFL
jgi:succinyl-CoA synthetase alpha subunit